MTVYTDLSLSEILWYRIGGAAKYVLECQSKDDILEAFEFIQKNHISKYLVAGLGSNMLVSDEYFDGAVIHICRKNDTKHLNIIEEGLIESFAGEYFDDLIEFSFKNKMTGLEWAGGLPGTVGAGVRGNVGAFGGEIKDHFVSAQILDLETDKFNITTKQKSEMDFAYRNSIIKHNKKLIVLSARFQFGKADDQTLKAAYETYHKNIEYRKVNHPLEFPSCGSTFKNIIERDHVAEVLKIYPDLKEKVETRWHGKVSTAALITKLGMSGYQIGNAQVSEKHSNFIVNLGGATFSEVYQVIHDIQRRFTEKFGFEPEAEVEIIQ